MFYCFWANPWNLGIVKRGFELIYCFNQKAQKEVYLWAKDWQVLQFELIVQK